MNENVFEIKKTIKKGEYLYALVPNHPRATKNGYVLEHRVIVENNIGRLLQQGEEVHHIDGNKKNNNLNNLELILSKDHRKIHSTKFKDGHFVYLVCANCGKEFKRKYNNRPEIKNNKNTFCSRKCSGKFNGFKRK